MAWGSQKQWARARLVKACGLKNMVPGSRGVKVWIPGQGLPWLPRGEGGNRTPVGLGVPFICLEPQGLLGAAAGRQRYLADLQGGDGTGLAGHQNHGVAMGQGRGQQGHKGKQGPVVRAHNSQDPQRLPKSEHRASQLSYLQRQVGGQRRGRGPGLSPAPPPSPAPFFPFHIPIFASS